MPPKRFLCDGRPSRSHPAEPRGPLCASRRGRRYPNPFEIFCTCSEILCQKLNTAKNKKWKERRREDRYAAGCNSETGKPIYKNVLGQTQVETKEKLKKAMKMVKNIAPVRAGQYPVGRNGWTSDSRTTPRSKSGHPPTKGSI